jgi:hypothetical protein
MIRMLFAAVALFVLGLPIHVTVVGGCSAGQPGSASLRRSCRHLSSDWSSPRVGSRVAAVEAELGEGVLHREIALHAQVLAGYPLRRRFRRLDVHEVQLGWRLIYRTRVPEAGRRLDALARRRELAYVSGDAGSIDETRSTPSISRARVSSWRTPVSLNLGRSFGIFVDGKLHPVRGPPRRRIGRRKRSVSTLIIVGGIKFRF